MPLLSLIVFLAVSLLTSPAEAVFFNFGDSTEKVTATEGKITIDVSDLGSIQSRHYRYRENDRTIVFFIVRDGQGIVKAALNACEICWKEGKGYQLEGGAMLCVNCGRKFALHRIGLAGGGCNPHPFRFWTDNNTVLIETRELMQGAGYFPENSR